MQPGCAHGQPSVLQAAPSRKPTGLLLPAVSPPSVQSSIQVVRMPAEAAAPLPHQLHQRHCWRMSFGGYRFLRESVSTVANNQLSPQVRPQPAPQNRAPTHGLTTLRTSPSTSHPRGKQEKEAKEGSQKPRNPNSERGTERAACTQGSPCSQCLYLLISSRERLGERKAED